MLSRLIVVDDSSISYVDSGFTSVAEWFHMACFVAMIDGRSEWRRDGLSFLGALICTIDGQRDGLMS
jgi:hypothetical protein